MQQDSLRRTKRGRNVAKKMTKAKKLAERVAELEKRLSELENRPPQYIPSPIPLYPIFPSDPWYPTWYRESTTSNKFFLDGPGSDKRG